MDWARTVVSLWYRAVWRIDTRGGESATALISVQGATARSDSREASMVEPAAVRVTPDKCRHCGNQNPAADDAISR